MALAYGRRGIPQLVENLQQPEARHHALRTLARSALAAPQAKAEALSASQDIAHTLLNLLNAPEPLTRADAATVIGLLARAYQGRIAAHEANCVPALEKAVTADADAAVAKAAAAALVELSRSRDGCLLLITHEPIVARLTAALMPPTPASAGCLATLANLLNRDLGVAAALASGLVPRLRVLLAADDPAVETVQLDALRALWNICNTFAGKEAAVEAEVFETLGRVCSDGSADAKRLAAGCALAITVAESGKRRADAILEPLLDLALDSASDAATVRNAVGALKNAAEYPKARKTIDRLLRHHHANLDEAEVVHTLARTCGLGSE